MRYSEEHRRASVCNEQRGFIEICLSLTLDNRAHRGLHDVSNETPRIPREVDADYPPTDHNDLLLARDKLSDKELTAKKQKRSEHDGPERRIGVVTEHTCKRGNADDDSDRGFTEWPGQPREDKHDGGSRIDRLRVCYAWKKKQSAKDEHRETAASPFGEPRKFHCVTLAPPLKARNPLEISARQPGNGIPVVSGQT
jgi:hypothetical protein